MLSDAEITSLEKQLEVISKFSLEFVALLTASVVIATLGLFENSAAVIIGAMIIAPLMRPLAGLSLSLLTADILLLQRAAITLVLGTLIGVSIACCLASLLHQIELTPEILARTKPTLLDLGIAFFAGVIGAYCQANKTLADSLAGVAIAVALVPPLSVVGIGLAFGQTDLWQGAGLLYLTNLVGISIAGALTFLCLGYAPPHRAKRGLMISSALVAMLIVPLAISMKSMILQNRLNTEIRQILKQTYTFRNARLRDVEIRRYRKPPLVLATVFTDQPISHNQVRMVQDLLVRQLNMALEFRIQVIPIIEINAAEEKAVTGKAQPPPITNPDQTKTEITPEHEASQQQSDKLANPAETQLMEMPETKYPLPENLHTDSQPNKQ
jgi:uncharacterized hydrophobic protein (TIGR00271 family)